MLLNFNLNHSSTRLGTSWGRGGGQVVSVLAFYCDDPSSNPAEVNISNCVKIA